MSLRLRENGKHSGNNKIRKFILSIICVTSILILTWVIHFPPILDHLEPSVIIIIIIKIIIIIIIIIIIVIIIIILFHSKA